MLLTHKPTEADLNNFLLQQSKLNVRYPGLEITRTEASNPDFNYRVNRVETTLGEGESTFECAVQHMQAWQQFQMSWIILHPSEPKIAPNTTLVVAANQVALWSMNACRIIYTIDESSEQIRRYGFAYGTLPSHVEQGEESFIIEWNRVTNVVTYKILAFSKPNHWLVAMCWPLAVLIQDQFRKQSLSALKAKCAKAN